MPQLWAMNEQADDIDAQSSGQDIAPRPRFRSATGRQPSYDKARLFAGGTRAVLGCAGFFASLLYLPIVIATPILAGVSLLMMVTGCLSVWRAVLEAPALKAVWRALAAVCALVTMVTVVLTLVLGAGALGPLHDLASTPDDGAVRFEMQR